LRDMQVFGLNGVCFFIFNIIAFFIFNLIDV